MPCARIIGRDNGANVLTKLLEAWRDIGQCSLIAIFIDHTAQPRSIDRIINFIESLNAFKSLIAGVAVNFHCLNGIYRRHFIKGFIPFAYLRLASGLRSRTFTRHSPLHWRSGTSGRASHCALRCE